MSRTSNSHRFHAEVLEGEHPRAAYRLRHEVGRAAHGDQVNALMPLDIRNRLRAAFRLRLS